MEKYEIKRDKLIKNNSPSNISLGKTLKLSESISFMYVSIHRALSVIEYNIPLDPPAPPPKIT